MNLLSRVPLNIEQQSLLLYSVISELQLTLIVNHHFSNQNTELQQETPLQHCVSLHHWQIHNETLLCLNTCIVFSIAAGAAVTKLMIGSVFICTLEHFQAISQSGNIILNRTDTHFVVL